MGLSTTVVPAKTCFMSRNNKNPFKQQKFDSEGDLLFSAEDVRRVIDEEERWQKDQEEFQKDWEENQRLMDDDERRRRQKADFQRRWEENQRLIEPQEEEAPWIENPYMSNASVPPPPPDLETGPTIIYEQQPLPELPAHGRLRRRRKCRPSEETTN